MVPMESSNLVLGTWEILCLLSVHVCLGLIVEFWSTVGIRVDHSLLWPDRFFAFLYGSKKWSGYMRLHVDIMVTLNSAISVILLLCFSFCYHPPHTHVGPCNIDVWPWKNHQKMVKISQYPCQIIFQYTILLGTC